MVLLAEIALIRIQKDKRLSLIDLIVENMQQGLRIVDLEEQLRKKQRRLR